MSRDLNDPRVAHILDTLAIWLHDDGETFEPTSVETLTKAMNLDQQRVEVVRAVAEAYLRTCADHAIDRLTEWAAHERRVKQEIEADHAAEAALVAIGVDPAAAERIVSKAKQEARVVQ